MASQTMIRRVFLLPADVTQYADQMAIFLNNLKSMNTYDIVPCYTYHPDGSMDEKQRFEMSITAAQDAIVKTLLPQVASFLGVPSIATHAWSVVEGY